MEFGTDLARETGNSGKRNPPFLDEPFAHKALVALGLRGDAAFCRAVDELVPTPPTCPNDLVRPVPVRMHSHKASA